MAVAVATNGCPSPDALGQRHLGRFQRREVPVSDELPKMDDVGNSMRQASGSALAAYPKPRRVDPRHRSDVESELPVGLEARGVVVRKVRRGGQSADNRLSVVWIRDAKPGQCSAHD